MPVPTVKLPLNSTVWLSAVSVIVTVSAATVPWKSVPPDCVIVTVPMSVPTASATVTTPVVFTVKLESEPLATPLTASRLIAFAIPVPTVSVTPSLIVASPRSIVPVAAPPIVAFAVTVTPVPLSPSVVVLAPVVAATVPATLTADGAVAVTPPTNVVLSPEPSPSVTAPVLAKVVVPAIEFVAPKIDTL